MPKIQIRYTVYDTETTRELCLRDLGLKSLPPELELFNKVKYLDCSFNLLRNLKHLPPNLETLRCINNKLHDGLPDDLPQSLTDLDCNGCDLYKLPVLPPNLKILYCGNNYIDEVDHLPESLVSLYCYRNRITKLDHLPSGLKRLSCWSNHINTLDYLPLGLKWLNCVTTDLESLDFLPVGLKYLECSTSVKTLYNLPPHLERIKYHEECTQIGDIPPSLIHINEEDEDVGGWFD